jgi:hypothetical protein
MHAYDIAWPPLSKTILTDFTILFSYMYVKYFNHIHPFFAFSFETPHSCSVPILNICSSFFKVYILHMRKNT